MVSKLFEQYLPLGLRLIAKLIRMIPTDKSKAESELIRKYEENLIKRNEPVEVHTETVTEVEETSGMDFSFTGQSSVNYCLECLQKHSYKALGLAEEALSFSRNAGEINDAAREKIRKAIKELVTAEDDLGVESRDEEINNRLRNIGAMMREIRKWAWTVALPSTQKDIDYVEEFVNRLRYLAEYVDKTIEIYYQKFPDEECPICKLTDEIHEFLKNKQKSEKK